MTEQEWESETDPLAILLPLFPDRDAPATRKLRLFLSSCSDRLRDRLPSGYNTTIRIAAQFADNCASAEDSDFAVYVAEGLHYSHPDYVASSRYYEEQYRKRTIPLEADGPLFNPYEDIAFFHKAATLIFCTFWPNRPPLHWLNPDHLFLDLLRDIFGNPFRPATADPSWMPTNGVVLARTMYETRDFAAMPLLADLLEESGCPADVSAHCRGPGPHVRGCWVVDLLLGKE